MIRRRPEQCRPDMASCHASSARLQIDGAVKQAIERGRNRLLMGALMFVIGFGAISYRLVDMAMIQQGAEPSLAETPVADQLRMERADIVDRNGNILATSLPTASLYADATRVIDPVEAARRLVRVLPDLSQSEIVARLSSERRFIWLRRHLTPDQEYAINRLGIPGLSFQREERRVYPHGRLAAHIVGFTDVDNRGLAGVEAYFDDALTGGREPLRLSIDIRAQNVLTDELSKAVAKFSAIGAAGVVLDATTGEVVAMASLPDYDANTPVEDGGDARFNRATLGVYEMGSTFKVFTAAMALDAGVVTLDGGYDATKPLRLAGFSINDYKGKHRWLSVPEIFIYSSNIGAAKMALALGKETQRHYLDELALLRESPVELPESGSPLVPATWREVNVATIGFGHGLSVSPLTTASAAAAVVNGGVLRPATLLKRRAGETGVGRQVLSPRTSDAMRGLMRLNVTHGSGKRADAIGYLVGGKTGSAEKLVRGSYAHNKLLSSFLAAFPMSDPRYVVLVVLDEPKGIPETHGYATGGWTAAPVVHDVIARTAPLLGIPPVERPAEMMDAAASPLLHQVAAQDGVRAAR